jgi:hypothetical protein
MRDPVVSADGVTYDRPSIELWFSGGGRTNLITGALLPHLGLVPNLALRTLVDDFARARLQCKLDMPVAAAEAKAAVEAKAASEAKAAAEENANTVLFFVKNQANQERFQNEAVFFIQKSDGRVG